MRAPQHIQPHSNFTFPVHSDKLSFKSGKRPFYYFHSIAGSQRGAAHFHRFGTVIEHEAEPVHLFVGDDGRGAFAAQYHIAADRLQAQGSGRSCGVTCTNIIMGITRRSTRLRRSLHWRISLWTGR